MDLKQLFPQAWYSDKIWVRLLLPLSWLYRVLANWQRTRQQVDAYRASVPVVIIGNIAVGGTGKTPLTLMLARALRAAGYSPAIVSRGYGGNSLAYPLIVDQQTAADECGDEALLLARHSQCPVVVDPVRSRAVLYAETRFEPDVILSDDGLQHYGLARQFEIAVIDGSRGLGNGLLLPAGPLRESAERLNSVDCVVINGDCTAEIPVFSTPRFFMHLQASRLIRLTDQQAVSVESWKTGNTDGKVHAVAGIGNPARFFASLRSLGFDIIEHAYADHYSYRAAELDFPDALPVVMTEKDAVKYQPYANQRHWALQVQAQLPESFATMVIQKLGKPARSPHH